MDHRSPRPVPAPDGAPLDLASPGPDRGRPGRVPSRRARRLAALAGAVATTVAAAALLGPAERWLADRDEYRCRFDAIRLDPPPPPWIRLGSREFLEGVRRRAALPETVAVLTADLPALGRAFALQSPWVAEVGRVRREGRDRLVVELAFRRPVAVVKVGDRPLAVIDEEAVVLPPEETDREAAGPLIEIIPAAAPPDLRPGASYSRLHAAGDGLTEPDPAVAACARLASFLRGRLDLGEGPGLPYRLQTGPSGMFLRVEDSRLIRWSKSATGDESPGGLDDGRKWRELLGRCGRLDWPAYDRAKLGPYLKFEGAHLILEPAR